MQRTFFPPKKARKNKGIMRRIINNLRRSEDYNNNGQKTISEIDTQAILVEPVLYLAGYDIANPQIIKRADRGSKVVQFDIEVYDSNGNLKIGIEVKSLNSNEFNINNQFEISGAKNKSGNLGLRCENFYDKLNKRNRNKIIYDGRAWECNACSSTSPCNNDKLEFCNYNKDGIGQLRAYCIKYFNQTPFRKEQLPDKLSEINKNVLSFMPILTNGQKWVIFKKDFIREPFNKIVVQDHAETYADLRAKDFFQIIIKKLRNT